MTRDDIIQMAREADSGFDGGPDADGTMANSLVGISAIERFASLVAAAEPEFQRCTGKPLTLSMQMGRTPINGTYECKNCHRLNAPLHPASTTPASWIDPWRDFTPCDNFVPLKWADPVDDEEILQMLREELPTLGDHVRGVITNLVDDGLIGAAVNAIYVQSGWTVNGVDNEAKIRRALLCDKVIHEYRRRKHESRTDP